jgi:type I restriction enzyme, S subunit
MELKPGYKLTEVGLIPEDWTVKPLGEVGESIIGLTYKPEDVKDHGTLVLRSSNIQEGVLRFDDNVFVQTDIAERIMVQPADILICVRNGSRALIGKTALLDDRTVGMTFGAFMAVFRSPVGTYVNYLFQSDILKRQINGHLGATINQITNKSLNSFRVPLPRTEAEQRAITAALSDMDALLSGLDRLIAKKRDLKQGAMQQLLTGQTRLPGFSGDWEVKRLEEIAGTDPENLGTDTPSNFVFNYIALEDVDCGSLRGHSEQVFTSAPSRARRKLRDRDVIVSTVRPNLQSHLLFRSRVGDWVCSTGFCVVRCLKGIASPEYVFAQLFTASVSRQIDALLTGSNYPAINSGDVRSLEIPVPTYDEQIAIAAVLSDMDAELSALEARRDKIRALKQGMMQELLTGKTRLALTGAAVA